VKWSLSLPTRHLHVPRVLWLIWTSFCFTFSSDCTYTTIPSRVFNVNTNTIQTNPKIYQPKVASQYIKPDICPDLLEGMELLHTDCCPSLRKSTNTLPPCEVIITFDPNTHQNELDKNIRWHKCPDHWHDPIISIIEKYWDVFCAKGLRRNIRGYICRIGTCNITRILLFCNNIF
jgi:hypothetical protein